MQDSHDNPQGGLSRRDFLRASGTTAAVAGTGLGTVAQVAGGRRLNPRRQALDQGQCG